MRLLIISLCSLSLAASVVLACSSDSSDDKAATPTGGTPEQLFRAIQPDLIKNCGGVDNQCHVNGTHKNAQGEAAALWLGPGDPYLAAKSYVGIIPITGDPADSKLLTQVEHDGPALVSLPDLFEGVKVWVTAETAADVAAHPVTDAFYIKDGPNVVSLAKLAADADGAQLTFDASTVDGTLFLDNMKITAPTKHGLEIDSPTFVILPPHAPVQTDSLAGFSGRQQIQLGATAQFYGGSTILSNWNALNRVKIVFNAFTLSDPQQDAAPPTGCKALDTFKSAATAAFKMDLGNGQSCASCHGVNGQPGSIEDRAVTTLDLRTLDADPAHACSETLVHVNLANKPTSEILLTCSDTPGGDPTHPVRGICGQQDASDPDAALPQCVPQAVVDGITTWINAETP